MRSRNCWNQRRIIRTSLGICASGICVSGLVACSQSTGGNLGGILPIAFNIDTTPINAIQQSPQSTAVYLKGKVGTHAPILQGVLYELNDGTGSVWVRTTGSSPKAGDEVTIKALTCYQSITLNGRSENALFVEQQDLLRTRPAS